MNTKGKVVFGIIGGVIVISVMIVSSIGTSMWGMDLHEIEQSIAEVESENRKLTDEIISNNSLTEVYENQEELGYQQATNVLYLDSDTSVAQAR
jgi:cell division protein FtsL